MKTLPEIIADIQTALEIIRMLSEEATDKLEAGTEALKDYAESHEDDLK